MSWIIYAIGAMGAAATSDLFRKLGSNLKDPFLANLLSQIGSVTMAIILFLLFSRKFENNTSGITYALLTGVFISIATTLFFKALSIGPGVHCCTGYPGGRRDASRNTWNHNIQRETDLECGTGSTSHMFRNIYTVFE